MIARAIEVHDRTWWRWVIAGWAAVLFFAWGPAFERAVLPVVSDIKVISMEADGVGTRMFVRFQKWRNCQYLGLNWEEILPDGTKRRAFLNLKPKDDNSGSTRPRGDHIAGPWYVGMPPDKVENHSIATLTYRCHPFWTTVMEVYP